MIIEILSTALVVLPFFGYKLGGTGRWRGIGSLLSEAAHVE